MGDEAAQQELGQWDGIVRRSLDIELRSIDETERSVEVTASTEDLDSHGDIILQFWDLGRYEKNPVVLWNHNNFESSRFSFGGAVRPDDLFPIGHASEVGVQGKKLKAKLVLGSKEYSAIAEKTFLGLKEKHVRAVSVGFRPGQVTRVLKTDGSTSHFELGSKERPNELVEISFVPMGSNPAAVAKSLELERRGLELAAPRETRTEPRASAVVTKSTAAESGSKGTNTMTDEEKAALEKARAELETAKVEKRVAEQAAQIAETRAKTAEETLTTTSKALEAEKALSTKLQSELEAASANLKKLSGSVIEMEIDKLVGKKLYPTERDEFIQLSGEVGIERVKSLVSTRPDLTITEPVTGPDGKPLAKSAGTPPPPAEQRATSASAEIAAEATKASQTVTRTN